MVAGVQLPDWLQTPGYLIRSSDALSFKP